MGRTLETVAEGDGSMAQEESETGDSQQRLLLTARSSICCSCFLRSSPLASLFLASVLPLFSSSSSSSSLFPFSLAMSAVDELDLAIPPADDPKAALRKLIQSKDDIEAQMQILHAQANEGQSLVDAEGFPRAGQAADERRSTTKAESSCWERAA